MAVLATGTALRNAGDRVGDLRDGLLRFGLTGFFGRMGDSGAISLELMVRVGTLEPLSRIGETELQDNDCPSKSSVSELRYSRVIRQLIRGPQRRQQTTTVASSSFRRDQPGTIISDRSSWGQAHPCLFRTAVLFQMNRTGFTRQPHTTTGRPGDPPLAHNHGSSPAGTVHSVIARSVRTTDWLLHHHIPRQAHSKRFGPIQSLCERLVKDIDYYHGRCSLKHCVPLSPLRTL